MMPCNLCGKGIIHVCSGRKGDRVTMGPTWLACGGCGYHGPKADHPPHPPEVDAVYSAVTYRQTVTYVDQE